MKSEMMNYIVSIGRRVFNLSLCSGYPQLRLDQHDSDTELLLTY